MEYQPLDDSSSEIRLLHILPSTTKSNTAVVHNELDIVRCTLRNVSLRDYTQKAAGISQASLFSSVNGWLFHKAVADIEPLSWPARPARWNWGDFAALSYAWGDATPVSEIIVNETVVEVRQNLAAFLRQFRHLQGDTSIGLWIDALCINQADGQERNVQVKRMRDIYQQASTVYAWIGPEREDGSEGMDLLLDVSKYNCTTADECKPFLTRLQHFPNMYSPSSWRGLYYMVLRPYWGRLWIIQELALGSPGVMILWGKQSISWNSLCKAIDILSLDAETTMKRVIHSFLDHNKEMNKGWWSSWSLLERLAMLNNDMLGQSDGRQAYLELKQVFSIGRGSEQTDPRDKVYGLLALMPPDITGQISPDYSASVVDVYIDFAKTVIDSTKTLDLICQARADLSTTGEFPTWVPNWSTGHNINVEMTMNIPYQASGNRTPEHNFLGRAMQVKGFIIDRVDGLGNRYLMAGQEHIDYTVQPRASVHAYGTQENAQDALWRTMLGNRDANGGPVTMDMLKTLNAPWPEVGNSDNTSIIEECFNGVRKANETLRLGDTDFGSLSHSTGGSIPRNTSLNSAQNSWLRCYTLMIDRRLTITERGYFGLVPTGAKQGDIVSVLFGCSVPVLLRLTENGDYFLVGETYVHGFMEGEAMLGLENGKYTERSFTIL